MLYSCGSNPLVAASSKGFWQGVIFLMGTYYLYYAVVSARVVQQVPDFSFPEKYTHELAILKSLMRWVLCPERRLLRRRRPPHPPSCAQCLRPVHCGLRPASSRLSGPCQRHRCH
jgi:hypothetical protein